MSSNRISSTSGSHCTEPGSPRADASPAAAAYDAVAPRYDELVAEDAWMRQLLWTRYERLTAAGDEVLELGCGTGLDTLFLARRGVLVTAVDVSQEMLSRLAEKARREGLWERITACQVDVARLDGWPDASFDAVVSAFAVLNTVPDLEGLAAETARVLRPGGRMLVHLLAPAGAWERWRRTREAGWGEGRRLAERRELTVSIGGRAVRHHVLPPADAERLFAGPFRVRRTYGLGFLWPRATSGRLPALARRLGRLELWLGAWPPFLGWGRFFVLELEKRG